MSKSPATYFLPIIVTVLLVLYAGTIGFMIYCAFAGVAGCDTCGNTKEISLIATTVGGLVSALAIAELSISVPGEGVEGLVFRNLVKWKAGLTWAYLIVWMAVGLGALVVGAMIQPEPDPTETSTSERDPSGDTEAGADSSPPATSVAEEKTLADHDVNQTLRDIGMAWLGLAVAAGLAYFGLTPPSATRRREDG